MRMKHNVPGISWPTATVNRPDRKSAESTSDIVYCNQCWCIWTKLVEKMGYFTSSYACWLTPKLGSSLASLLQRSGLTYRLPGWMGGCIIWFTTIDGLLSDVYSQIEDDVVVSSFLTLLFVVKPESWGCSKLAVCDTYWRWITVNVHCIYWCIVKDNILQGLAAPEPPASIKDWYA